MRTPFFLLPGGPRVAAIVGLLTTWSVVGAAPAPVPAPAPAPARPIETLPGPSADRPSFDLSGEWEFKMDPRDVGREEKWFEVGAPYDRKIRVPGAWNAQGFGFESEPLLREYEARQLNTRGVPASTLGPEREADRVYSVFPGPAWYRTKVQVPAGWEGRKPRLIFGGVHRDAEVWINGKPAARHRSYLTPFAVDVSPFAKPGESFTVVVRVDARRNRDVDPLMGCLDTLDFLYVTWGGLHRRVWLEAVDAVRMHDLFVVPHVADGTVEIRVAVEPVSDGGLALEAEILDTNQARVVSAPASIPAGDRETAWTVRLPEPRLWSPRSPYLYTARVRLRANGREADVRSVRFGLREFKVANGGFQLNGQPIFLRGYGEDCIFPNTICPPSDREEFRRRLALSRQYGFNYVRHHSWTPPEEYLEVADELGMMLQPEFPFAYAWDLPKAEPARRAALEQWEAAIRQNRNHPSIVTWCMGNELYNSFDLAPEMYRLAKQLDPTRPIIDSDGCNFKHKDRETLDFTVVQFNEGSSIGFQDGKYALPSNLTKPVIAHEMGYFVTLPDLQQLDRFARGLRPYWLLQARDLAARNGVTAFYPEWLAASYRLQAASLKCNLEAARRSGLSGTSVWLFQDYPNCAEGVVDMFLQPKGVTAERFRQFNAPTVVLLDAPRRNWRAGEQAEIHFAVSRFEDAPSAAASLRWALKRGSDPVAAGVQDNLRIEATGVQQLPPLTIRFPPAGEVQRLTLSVALDDNAGRAENSWDLWVFPEPAAMDPRVEFRGVDAITNLYPAVARAPDAPPRDQAELLVTRELTPDALERLERGRRVLLLDPEPVFATEKTNFRLSSWDGGGPSGTLVDQRHPALPAMQTDGWCDLQFYDLIQGSKSVLLDGLPVKVAPLVRCIDRPTRLANRAYLFEANIGRGKLLVSGFNFARGLAKSDPCAVYFLDQLVQYGLRAEFAPSVSLPVEALQQKGAK